MVGSLAVTLVGQLLVSVIPLSSGDDLEARWREEYPLALRELQEVLRCFTVEGKLTRRFFDGKVLVAGECKLVASGERRLVVRNRKTLEPRPKEGDPKDDVQCLTPKYTFHLRKIAGAGPYLILNYGPRRAGDDLYINMDFVPTVFCMVEFEAYTLLHRMQSPTFVLKGIGRVRDGESEFVRIDYDWESERAFESGSIYLEPARKWAVRRSDMQFSLKPSSSDPGSTDPSGKPLPPTRIQHEVKYQDLPGGKPFPVYTERTVRLPGSAKYQVERFEAKRVTLDEPPPEWFMLSHYGLPDVPLRPAPQISAFSLSSPWLWGSFATALVSFLLLRSLRRNSRTSAD
jgi:hypothetical protein